MSRLPFWYDLGIRGYVAGIRLASPFNQKAKSWISGRKNLLAKIAEQRADLPEDLIWMHCASLGEFEQGRPVLEAIKKELPAYGIVLTFFSPSGFEIRKTWDGADAVWYLPADTAANAKRFISILKPKAGIFVKYDFWLQHINAAAKENVPLYLISGLFRREQIFFKSSGMWFRRALDDFRLLFVQDSASVALLRQHLPDLKPEVVLAPDTRFDRVSSVAAEGVLPPEIAAWIDGSPVLVAGSTWTADDLHLALLYKEVLKPKGWKLIVAPHETDLSHITTVKKNYREAGAELRLWSENKQGGDVLVIDSVGLLSTLYRVAQITYIGGGFGSGIHNTLEAAVYGLPILFGPKYGKFREAVDLVEGGAAKAVRDGFELVALVAALIEQPAMAAQSGLAAKNYVGAHTGGTAIITKRLLEDLG